jgi:hypothetical protein
MKNIVLIAILVAMAGAIEVQAQILASRVYPLESAATKKTQLFSGSGAILSSQTATYHTLSGGKQTAVISGKQEEVLIIIKNGKANVQLLEEQKIHVLDLETIRTLPVKFGSITIEKSMPRVFTTNNKLHDFLGYTTEIPDSLKRRFVSFEIIENIF